MLNVKYLFIVYFLVDRELYKTLEMWIDGILIATDVSDTRTDMRVYWDSWPGFGDNQEGWFWGAEKQAAVGLLTQYEDYKGLLDEVRFWSRAKSPSEISTTYSQTVDGTEEGLVGVYQFDEGTGSAVCNSLASHQCINLINMPSSYWVSENAPLDGSSMPPVDLSESIFLPLILNQSP